MRQIERRAKRRMWRSRLSIVALTILIPIGLFLVPGLSESLTTEPDPAEVDKQPDRSQGSRVVIASGRFDPTLGGPFGGEAWELIVWNKTERYCWSVSVRGAEQNTQCRPRDAAAHDDDVFRGWGYNVVDGESGYPQSLAMGEIRRDVESIEFRFRDGMIPARVIRPPADMGIPARFFVALLPNRLGLLAAFDSDHVVLGTRRLRVQ